MRSDGAYWRRVEDFADQIKGNIDTERRYTRMLNDCAIAGAAAYGKSLDQVKGDIEERFTRRYLYTPTEYYDVRLESGDRESSSRAPTSGRTGQADRNTNPAAAKSRERGRRSRPVKASLPVGHRVNQCRVDIARAAAATERVRSA